MVDSLLHSYYETSARNTLDKAFITLEQLRNKEIEKNLIAGMHESNVRQVNNILQRYNELTAKMNRLRSRNQTRLSADSVDVYESEINEFKNNVIHRFPAYTFFFSTIDSLPLKFVQTKIIHEKQAIINYAVYGRHIHALVTSRDSAHAVILPGNADDIVRSMRELVTPLYSAKNPKKLTFNKDIAYALYQQLFEPLEKHLSNIESIVIIPDKKIWGLPFEALIQTPMIQKNDATSILYGEFRNVDFLIKKYAIAYSASVVGLSTQLTNVYPRPGRGRKLLTMSGVAIVPDTFDPWCNYYATENQALVDQEIHRISQRMWRHENMIDTQATETNLVSNNHAFRWIHLALPAVFYTDSPAQSYVGFASDSTTKAYTKLHMGDIITSELPTDQVILSRSAVYMPADSIGTAIAALPQSLLLSGVRSVIWSRWLSNGTTITRFMSKFYWELKYKRQTNMLALQQAKLAALRDSFVFDEVEISSAHPYFWASYVLIGNTHIRPPTFSTIPPYMVIVIVYVVVILVALIIVRKTVDTNRE